MTTNSPYGLRAELSLPYEEAVERATALLAEEGFGILTEIDVQTTLKTKLDADFRRYVILGACNPPLALEALGTELEVGLLMPCNVIVYEEGQGSVVAVLDPVPALALTGNAAMQSITEQVRAKMDRVVAGLQAA